MEPSAQRDLRKLVEPTHSRILKAQRRLEVDPRHKGARMLTGFRHQWRVRAGDYRVLYEIDDKGQVVHVYRVVHRSEAYR